MKIPRKRLGKIVGAALITSVLLLMLCWYFYYRITNGINAINTENTFTTTSEPVLLETVVAKNLSQPVALLFPNQETLLIAQQSGEMIVKVLSGLEQRSLGVLPEIQVSQYRGLQDVELDTSFFENRYMYACYNAFSPERGDEIRVARFSIATDYTKLEDRIDILTVPGGTPSKNQGCALAMDNLGYLWVATGDMGIPSAAQDPKNLSGKVLRIMRDGNPAQDNQIQPFDPRIYSFGHKDPQGIVLLSSPLLNGAYGYMIENSGDTRGDKLNQLLQGNFGWDPNVRGVYSDAVPSTDKNKFPNAILPLWSFEGAAVDVTDIERLERKRWQAWQNHLVITAKKKAGAQLVELAADGSYKSSRPVLQDYPSLSIAVEGPDGSLYIGVMRGLGRDDIVQIRVLCTVCD